MEKLDIPAIQKNKDAMIMELGDGLYEIFLSPKVLRKIKKDFISGFAYKIPPNLIYIHKLTK